MEKTKEQMYEKRNEVLENILAELKNEYEGNGFSCVISVNDGTGTATLCYGSPIGLACNLESIEENDALAKVKNLIQILKGMSELKND